MRGKRRLRTTCCADRGITPADAGKTLRMPFSTSLSADHPRRCGENLNLVKAARWNVGSPPQVRGKLPASAMPKPDIRITPAGAGKTLDEIFSCSKPQDHPRRCGENSMELIQNAYQGGSPPQVRGKRFFSPAALTGKRITPAGAGKTALPTGRSLWRRDHPRRCGEN